LFGCVRVVWNDALALRKQSKTKPKSAQLQKVIITQAKLTEKPKWLSEVSNIPLQQSVSDLDTAFKHFFAFCKGKRKGRFRRISQIQKKNKQPIRRFENWRIFF